MSWATLPPEIREIAERVCTAKQLDALKLWDAGAGYERVGLMLGISGSTARDHIRRGLYKIGREAERLGLEAP